MAEKSLAQLAGIDYIDAPPRAVSLANLSGAWPSPMGEGDPPVGLRATHKDYLGPQYFSDVRQSVRTLDNAARGQGRPVTTEDILRGLLGLGEFGVLGRARELFGKPPLGLSPFRESLLPSNES